MRFPIGLTTSLTSYIIRKKLARERFVPLVLMLEPLFACNLTCAGCGRIREYKDRAAERMTVEECLDSSRECGAPIVSVCGGEPLIHPDIGPIVAGLLQMRRYVYLCTNGTLLAHYLDRFEPSPRLLLNVHIDGPRDVHDAVVQREGVYDSAAAGIKSAVGRGFAVTVNTTIYKQTDMTRIDELMTALEAIGVGCFMLSPAYSYESVDDKDAFLSREDVRAKFADIDRLSARHRLADTPAYIDFLRGKRELACTAWGNPTRNVAGWRSPCYLIADRHFATYQELIQNTDWNSYGPGRDDRCRDCMVHCGFEPTAALMLDKRKGDLWNIIKWQIKG
jgi:hopanoid biosynthesis associated radical SAM protein HpnH